MGGLSNMLTQLIEKPKGSFASSYETLESGAKAEMDKLIETFAQREEE